MTTETILTDDEKDALYSAWQDRRDEASYGDLIDSVEQAVLQSPEIQALRNQDPLQGAANWIVKAITNCDVTDIQYHLIIGYNRAKRLFDAAMEHQK